MKKGLQFLAVLAAFLFVSCEKDGLNYTERQIVGEWDYTKVKYTREWSVSTSDLSMDYEDIQLTFNSDFSANYLNTFTNESGSGLWELSQTYSDDDNCINMIFASFTDDESGELSQVVFESAVISNRTIRASYKDKEGCFRYVLKQ
ncbi:MAG: hypothetical protein GQ574_15280 [Crocinitomix sp.]|nr:hypothetical protein [Crocinitomix sp.]